MISDGFEVLLGQQRIADRPSISRNSIRQIEYDIYDLYNNTPNTDIQSRFGSEKKDEWDGLIRNELKQKTEGVVENEKKFFFAV